MGCCASTSRKAPISAHTAPRRLHSYFGQRTNIMLRLPLESALYAPLRRRGHSKEGHDNQPQVIIALAVTRDGMPVRSWVLPGDTADVTTVARIKDDLRAWRLGRCLFVGDAGMYSADNLAELSRGLGRYILAVPMRRVRDIEAEVLTRPGRYKQVADNLQVKEVWVGDGERRKRYVLCLNPQEAERERAHREP